MSIQRWIPAIAIFAVVPHFLLDQPCFAQQVLPEFHDPGVGQANSWQRAIRRRDWRDDREIAQLAFEMGEDERAFDTQRLHRRGVEGLAELLDYMYPQPLRNPTKQAEIVVHIDALTSVDYERREGAENRLVAEGYPYRATLEAARLRAPGRLQAAMSRTPQNSLTATSAMLHEMLVQTVMSRILHIWGEQRSRRHAGQLQGFFDFLVEIEDPERLDILASRTASAVERCGDDPSYKEVVSLGIARLARTHDDRYLDVFIPLLNREDDDFAEFVIDEIVGQIEFRAPKVLLEAARSNRPNVVLRAIPGFWDVHDEDQEEEVLALLRSLLDAGNDKIKLAACNPLIQFYDDASAFAFAIEQIASDDEEQACEAIHLVAENWPPKRVSLPKALAKQVVPRLRSDSTKLRRAAVDAIGHFRGEEVLRLLVPMLRDPADEVVYSTTARIVQASEALDRKIVERLLNEAVAMNDDGRFAERVEQVRKQIRAASSAKP